MFTTFALYKQNKSSLIYGLFMVIVMHMNTFEALVREINDKLCDACRWIRAVGLGK